MFTILGFEPMKAEAFDYILLLSFILLLPVATVVCVASKLRHVQPWAVGGDNAMHSTITVILTSAPASHHANLSDDTK